MCHYRGAQEEWGCAGLAEQGQGYWESSRTMVAAVSLQGCSGGLHMCRAGLRMGQGDRECSRMMVTAVSLQGCSGGLGVCRVGQAGAGGPGTFQDDRHSCVTTELLRRTGGVQGRLGRGQRDRECSRRMVSVISLCGYMCHCDRALARLERTGWERAVSLNVV